MSKKLTTEQFIEKAKLIHGDKYDYSKTIYINYSTKIEIICKKHGSFFQTPNGHLEGKDGCNYCSKKVKKTQEQFIEEAKKIHGDKYDYSKTVYNGIKEKVTIVCKKHGDFTIIADSHINKKEGCPICSGKTYNNFSFIERAKLIHGDRYNYSKTNYINCKEKIIIICPKHGEFSQQPRKHLEGQGCPKCSFGKEPKTFEKEINKIFKKNIILLEEYKDVYTKMKIKCRKCQSISERRPTDLLKGYACYNCSSSSLESFCYNWLSYNKIKFNKNKTFKDLKDNGNLSYDFYIPEKNLLIECQGVQHYYNSFNKPLHEHHKQFHHDWLKRKYAKNNNINLLYINYKESFDKIENKLKENVL